MAIIVRKASEHYGRALKGYVVISGNQTMLLPTKKEAAARAIAMRGSAVKRPAPKVRAKKRAANPIHAKIHNLKYEVMVACAGDTKWMTEAVFNDPKEAIKYAKDFHTRHSAYRVKVEVQ